MKKIRSPLDVYTLRDFTPGLRRRRAGVVKASFKKKRGSAAKWRASKASKRGARKPKRSVKRKWTKVKGKWKLSGKIVKRKWKGKKPAKKFRKK